MQTYRVYIYIPGAPNRPPYDSFVDVKASDERQAGDNAKRKLQQTSHFDVLTSNMQVKRVEKKSRR